jgi:hypothetical protein
VAAGVAITLVPVAADNPAVGNHAYVVAADAVNVTPVPGLQYKAEVGVTATTGNAFTVTATIVVDVAAQLSVTVTVYVPVAAGVAAVITGL